MNLLSTQFIRKKLALNYWDGLALLIVFAVILAFAWTARQMATPYHLGEAIPISLHPRELPFYALRTVLRMLIALLVSLLFTFIFGTWAAKSQAARRIIIPTIDILQSVPILGFLSVVIAPLMGLFSGSMLGPECAAIFAIFTSQAWNMALGFYQTVRSVPAEMNEAARLFHLSAWQRFWKIDVPFSMPGLLWNTMASMSGSWFFVVASEAITVANQEILLPGIGSYIAVATHAADLHAISYAVITMFVVIVIYDQLLFRPLVAWSEKFKTEREGGVSEGAQSWMVDLLRRTSLMRWIGSYFAYLFNLFVNLKIFSSKKSLPSAASHLLNEKIFPLLWDSFVVMLGIIAFTFILYYMIFYLSMQEILHVFFLGLITSFRVLILIIICSLIWVPIGIWIGLRPNAARISQPIAQLLAAFPANLFYPFIVMFIVNNHLNSNFWLTPLMILGSQWYILFNVIAGASTLPKDLLQVTDNLGVYGWLRARRFLLPGIFPYYVTGAMTAAGGAWNASIVAEVASWGSHTVSALGLGAYIKEYTTLGNFSQIALGIGMMCSLVLIFNRLIWRPLYVYAEEHFLLD